MAALVLGLAVLSVAFVACGDDDDDDDGGSAEDKQAIATFVEDLASYNGETATQEDIDYYMAHITDSFVQDFGTEDVAACEANAAECIGEPLPGAAVSPDSVEIDGDTATAIIMSDIGSFGIKVLIEGDDYKATDLFVPSDDVGDAEVVDMELAEFAFAVDVESDAVKSGDFALSVTNGGEQTHEVALVALPAEGTVEELLQDDSFQPEPIIVKFPFAPGDEANIALPAPLDPGRYAFVCFLPDTDDPEGTPHAFKGMTAEFTVE